MWDENGIWQEGPPTIFPGPSGGATGALDLMNVMQSGQNYNQEHAAKMKFLLLKMLADKNAQSIVNDPEAATAVGMTPDALQAAYAQTPEGQFHTWSANNPQASMEDIYMQQAREGLVPPASLGSNVRSLNVEAAKHTRELTALDAKDRASVFRLAASYSRDGYDNPFELALSDLAASKGQAPVPEQGQAPAVTATTELKGAQTNFIKGPKSDLTKAQTAFTTMRTNWLPMLYQAQTNNAYASATHKDALTQAVDLANDLKAQEAGGAMTQQQAMAQREKAQRLRIAVNKMQNDPVNINIIRKGGPQAEDLKQQIQGMVATASDAEQAAANAPRVKVTQPRRVSATTPDAAATSSTGGPAPSHQFPNEKAFIDAYIAKWKVPPSDAVLAQAKQENGY